MISIKKFIERNGEELFQAALDSYRSVLNAVAESGVEACPPLGSTLRQNLLRLHVALSGASTPAILQERPRSRTGAVPPPAISNKGPGKSRN
jgi:hypothetical protein